MPEQAWGEWGEWGALAAEGAAYARRLAAQAALWLCVYVCACGALYWGRARRAGAGGPGRARRALLVVAHPDDECMFFGPTVYRLREQAVDVHLLCLSDGNFDGLGQVRRGELWRACAALGIPDENICLVSDTRLPDNPRLRWPAPVAAHLILHRLEAYDIDMLVTFDRNGVSSHINHSSLFYAIAYLFVENKMPKNCTVYTLDTVNVLRKYWGYLDLPLSCILSSKWYFLTWTQSKRIVRAMKQYNSQMVWFRHFYVVFSRYMVINTLREVTLVDIELELTVDD